MTMTPTYCMHPKEDRKVLMHPVFHDNQCRGWWCPECNNWIQATGREKGFQPGDWHDLKERLKDENRT